MNPKCIFLFALVFSGSWACARTRTDMAPGLDWYLANAKVIETVQAEMPVQSEGDPSPSGSLRVWVKDVLKGVDTAQEVLLPQGSLNPGQTALILFQYEPPANYEPGLQSSPEARPVTLVWPMDSSGKLDTHGVPAQSQSGFLLPTGTDGIDLALIKKNIATASPEEVGLYHQVLEALIFPDKFRAQARLDAERATYVRLVIAILDLNRNVPSFARLLESQDPNVRAVALKHLEMLTRTTVPAPKDESPRSLHEWSQTWARQQATSHPLSRWPPVPADLTAPPDTFPQPLIQALQNQDADDFAKAFADWLDSGAMRDREIKYASTLNRDLVQGSNLAGAIGLDAYLPPAPRLRPDVIFNRDIPVVDRMKAIALLAQITHHNRFANERAEAKALLASETPDSDMLRRAAFWELRDVNTNTAGRIALKRLVQNGEDESTQRFILGLCVNFHLDDDALDAARAEIQAKGQTFIDGLFAYLETHRDDKAQWIGRLFCQEGLTQVIPVLLSWLKDPDAQVRKAAAFNLCWLPSADAVPNLLDAIHSETDRAVKAQLLVAQAQTGDKRGLDTLLAAAREPYGPDDAAEIVSGLGRIRDPKALATLADMVEGKTRSSHAADDRAYLLPSAVNAFGYISQLYAAHVPDRFESSSGISDAQVRLDVERIEQWRKSQTDK